jgi:DNA invertase Pin-like site-specific DNA recombinase
MNVYYARTSTDNQEGFSYELDKKKTEYDLVVFDKGVSGSVDFTKRDGGKRIMEMLSSNEITKLTTKEFSRIGRTISNTLSILDLFRGKNVCVRIEGLGLDSIVDGKENPSWKIISTTMALCADLERDLLLERIANGKRVAREAGVKFGRKHGSNETTMKFMNKPKNIKIREYLKKGYKYEEIIKIVGTSNSTISKVNKFSKTYEKNVKQNISPNQLDLMVEVGKVEKATSTLSKGRVLTNKAKDVEITYEEFELTQEMKENRDIMKLVDLERAKQNEGI